jgi:hypothetical protein
MPVWVKVILTAFVVITVPLALILFGLTAGFGTLCNTDLLQTISSPSGRRKLVVFQRDCGATTGFSTQASLLTARDHLTGKGNVFIADTDRGKAPSGPGGGPRLAASWIAEDTVELRYHPNTRVFRAESVQAGVTIRYARDSAL